MTSTYIHNTYKSKCMNKYMIPSLIRLISHFLQRIIVTVSVIKCHQTFLPKKASQTLYRFLHHLKLCDRKICSKIPFKNQNTHREHIATRDQNARRYKLHVHINLAEIRVISNQRCSINAHFEHLSWNMTNKNVSNLNIVTRQI